MPLLVVVGVPTAFFSLCCFLLYCEIQRSTKRIRSKVEAEQKARELLKSILPPEKWDEFSRTGEFSLESRSIPGRVYKIPSGRRQIAVRDDGRLKGHLCIEPTQWIPDSDLVLTHFLSLQANELEYLRTANFYKASGSR